ncbi:hypothetical protein AB1N83_014226 [Pleurotus pulmonarius]
MGRAQANEGALCCLAADKRANIYIQQTNGFNYEVPRTLDKQGDILEVPALGGLGWRRVQWTANADNAASIRCAERMGMKMEASVLRWSYCLGEEKEGMDAPAERGGGKGRHSSLLAVCWDDWENGVRDHVARLVERR